MIVDLPFSGLRAEGRPLKMGFFHISNNNLSIRRECAREVGMYDLNATKSEDVEICFRVALSPGWVAWREDAAVVRHKGRRTLWGLITQMWGWGYYVGYPYAKTGIRGVYLYWLTGRKHRLLGRLEMSHFPILVCVFGTDFYLATALAILFLGALVYSHLMIAAGALIAMLFAARDYLYDVRHAGLSPL